MYYHTPYETALLIARMLKRYGKTRARVSREAVRWFSRRQQLRHRFLSNLEACLDDLGWILIELDSGGFGFVARRAIEGAGRVISKRLHDQEEIYEINDEKVDWNAVEDELAVEDYDE